MSAEYVLNAGQDFVIIDELKNLLVEARKNIPEGALFLTNPRKFFLTRIYENLTEALSKDPAPLVRDVNIVRPGFLTNPSSASFLEVPHVVLVLTKNHNGRELSILKEIELMKVPHTIFVLGSKKKSKADYTFRVANVKALYQLMYNVLNLDTETPPKEFIKKISLRTE